MTGHPPKELDELLAKAKHHEVLELLQIHCERGEYTNAKQLILDDVLVIDMEKNKGSQDLRIRKLSLAPNLNGLPVYLARPIQEFIDSIDAQVPHITRCQLKSERPLAGRLLLDDWTLLVDDGGGHVLDVGLLAYDTAAIRDSRTSFKMEFLNLNEGRSRASSFVRLFSLYTGISLEIDACNVLPAKGAPLLACQDTDPLRTVTRGLDKVVHYDAIDLSTLQELLGLLPSLPESAANRLGRALHWIGRPDEKSGTDGILFAAVAIEALIENPVIATCEHCGSKKFQEGASEAYRIFLDKHLKGDFDKKKLAKRLYNARSKVAHGGRLSSFDDPATPVRRAFSSWDDLSGMMRGVPRLMMREALANWMREAAGQVPPA